MPGVPKEFAEHALEVSKIARPIKQNLWRFAKDRKQSIEVEVCKLLAAGFIREYNTWFGSQTRFLYPRRLED
jgi:hypothetical protein